VAPDSGAGDEAAATAAQEAANAVSLLQEYVQSCTAFSPHKKILTWNFEQQLENETTLQFRATVSFMFNSIPHHFCGGWQSSKKKAQRDTAERVRHYLARSFEQPEPGAADTTPRTPASGNPEGHRAAIDPCSLPEVVVEELWAAFEGRSGSLSSCGSRGEAGEDDASGLETKLRWQMEERSPLDVAGTSQSEVCRATVTFFIHTVPHHFAGGWCANANQARADTAERVLWYFGMRAEGFAAAADKPLPAPPLQQQAPVQPQPHVSSPSTSICSGAGGASPPRNFGGGCSGAPHSPASSTATASNCSPANGVAAASVAAGTADPSRQAVEDKTVLMQVQNALQKSFARETPPGQRVWVWSYEADEHDPQLFRAHVQVPCWGESFFGDWCRGKKLAQRSACLVVKGQLDRRGAAGSL